MSRCVVNREVIPADVIKEAMAERRWTQGDLAIVLGRPRKMVNEILGGKRGISPRAALELEDALGVDAMELLRLQGAYRLVQLEVRLQGGE